VGFPSCRPVVVRLRLGVPSKATGAVGIAVIDTEVMK